MKKRIVVVVEGGMVQNVYSDTDDVNVVVLDGDVEGADESELVPIADDDGFVNDWIVCNGPVYEDAAFVNRVFDAAKGVKA